VSGLNITDEFLLQSKLTWEPIKLVTFLYQLFVVSFFLRRMVTLKAGKGLSLSHPDKG